MTRSKKISKRKYFFWGLTVALLLIWAIAFVGYDAGALFQIVLVLAIVAALMNAVSKDKHVE